MPRSPKQDAGPGEGGLRILYACPTRAVFDYEVREARVKHNPTHFAFRQHESRAAMVVGVDLHEYRVIGDLNSCESLKGLHFDRVKYLARPRWEPEMLEAMQFVERVWYSRRRSPQS